MRHSINHGGYRRYFLRHAAGGSGLSTHQTEKLLRCNPKYTTRSPQPIVTYFPTIFAGTGNIFGDTASYRRVAKEQGVKTCCPLSTAVSAQIASPHVKSSGRVYICLLVMEGHGDSCSTSFVVIPFTPAGGSGDVLLATENTKLTPNSTIWILLRVWKSLTA